MYTQSIPHHLLANLRHALIIPQLDVPTKFKILGRSSKDTLIAVDLDLSCIKSIPTSISVIPQTSTGVIFSLQATLESTAVLAVGAAGQLQVWTSNQAGKISEISVVDVGHSMRARFAGWSNGQFLHFRVARPELIATLLQVKR